MSQAHSPPHNSSFPRQSPPQEASNQDWVCLKCNNLNFSFRKKCNRCKVQSREDNQQLLYADYYYYEQFYAYEAAPHPSGDPNPTGKPIEHPPQKVTRIALEDRENVHPEDHLPSVSPLVKKYSTGSKVDPAGGRGLFVWKLFGEDSWTESDLPVLHPSLLGIELSPTDDDEPTAQFVRSVQQMII